MAGALAMISCPVSLVNGSFDRVGFAESGGASEAITAILGRTVQREANNREL